MQTLDPRSLIAMGFFMAVVMSVVLVFMRRSYPPSIRGLGFWAMSPAMWLLGSVFFGLNGSGSLELWRWFGNGLLLMGFVFFHWGCRRFFEQPLRVRPALAWWALAMLALVWFSVVSPSYAVRVAIVTVAIASLHLATLVVLFRSRSGNFPVRMVQVTLALHFAILVGRLITLAKVGAADELLTASLMQTFYVGAYVSAVLLLSIGAVLMATDRVRTELEHMATHDFLTSTLNRRAILGYCADEHERSVRYGQAFALMMIDLDHFKTVNDTHGHQHGDRVLVHFSECTRAALRRADRFGRYGGEEFLVLLPNASTESALPVAQRIHACLSSGHALDCKVSIGVTHWQGPGDSLDVMLGRADAALYQAKAEGRNRTCVG